jgi:hypothetical protein
VRDLEASVTLVDGAVDAGVWRRIDAALDLLTLAPDADVALECDPAGAHVTWYLALDRSQPARVRASGTRLFALRALEVGEASCRARRTATPPSTRRGCAKPASGNASGPGTSARRSPPPVPRARRLPGSRAASRRASDPDRARTRHAARSAAWVRVAGL